MQGTEHLEKFTVEEKEKEKLEKSLAEREEANGKLKELLKSEQSSAEKLRTEIRRLVTYCSTNLNVSSILYCHLSFWRNQSIIFLVSGQDPRVWLRPS